MGALVGGTAARLQELGRQPLTLGLLVLLPPVVVETYSTATASFPRLPSPGPSPATAGRLTGALFAVAFLAGVVGLFQVISARRGDERLAIAGFPVTALLAGRLLALAAITLVGAGVAYAALAVEVPVTAPLVAAGALAAAGLLYGLLGLAVGAVVPRELEGSIVLVFLADIDNAIASGLLPIDASASLPAVGTVGATDLAPLYHPHELLVTAVLEGGVATAHLWGTVGWLAAAAALATAAYARSTGAVDGGGEA